MKVVRHLLLGSAAGLLAVAGAQAADLPTRKAAPVNYVRICDAYGAGFFYIPGTDTCLKVGGLALFETRIFNTPFSIGAGFLSASSPVALGSAVGTLTNPNPAFFASGGTAVGFRASRARDNVGMAALGRVELDARTATGYGTLRAFIRVDSSVGFGATTQTGAANQLYNTTAGPFPAKEQTIVNKAFVQFAGLTAGRAQSMFDFYADAYNYEALRGSNASPVLLAYTYTFGGPFTGFSATISAEDSISRREQIGSVVGFNAVSGVNTPLGAFGFPANGFPAGNGTTAFMAGQQIPDIVGNLRVDQPWGSAQLSGAAHQLRTTLYPGFAPTGVLGVFGNPGAGAFTAAGFSTTPYSQSNDWGFAVQGGVKVNTPWIAPGDVLYVQATYENGAVGYITGNTLAFTGGFWASSLNYGNGLAGTPSSNNWVEATFSDCVYVLAGGCKKQSGGAITAAFKHYWLPTWSSAFYGSFMAIRYNSDVTTPTLQNVLGIPNYKELRVGSNLVWTPVTGFDIGAELTYTRGITDKPFGLAPDIVLQGVGLPRFSSTSNVIQGRLRVQRAF